ncbi:exo-alpha-sialidase [Sphingobacterium sp. lm-10]|uniref:sialidase family protein n=1 Tax=Sphingobacterium sp. lm-10 TaxID=2944904 RepID=UPI002020D49C|nr:sialidase family protein [Sphingobacterium sp. lm-10]MCL7987613.1 exo-alpha-sialidase [Sphingobacterium sp. lm-10]
MRFPILTLIVFLNIIACSFAQSSEPGHSALMMKVSDEFVFQEDKFFAQCHASTLEETKDGTLLSSWFGGSHEGNKDVVIYGSRQANGRWEDPQIWADGRMNDTVQYPCWNPVLFRAKDETEIFLYYKVGPNPREWWGMVKTSLDGGKTWGEPRRLPENILGPIKNRPLELSDGTIVSPSSVELSEERWLSHVEISKDRQKTWQAFPVDHQSELNTIQPSVIEYANGRLQVFCRSKEGVVTTATSEDQGRTWSNMQQTSLVNPNSGTDVIRINDLLFIVYNPDIPGKDWWEGRTKLRLACSKDGYTWEDVFTFEDEDKGEFSYPTIIQTADGLIHVSYTHNRKNIRHFVLADRG